jgi:hypothetical protein
MSKPITNRQRFQGGFVDKEWRWLEVAKIEQELVIRNDNEKWININWKN